MNWAKANRDLLICSNYVLKANPIRDYWFGIWKKKLNEYYSQLGSNFNIIIHGNEITEGDFYVIPFVDIQDLLREENLYSFKGGQRWIGGIRNHILKFRHSNINRNISEYYSVPNLGRFDLQNNSKNDYAIENAKREVQIRLKQSVFRKKVLDNFNNRCCLTGIAESDLLVASHIIPWAAKIEDRLSPHNGLCLSVLYDKLFDKGYFTLNSELKVLITSRVDRLSDPIKTLLIEISKCKITNPIMYEISTISLEFHRQFIFDKFII